MSVAVGLLVFIPTVWLCVMSLVADTCEYDGGRIGPTHCAVIAGRSIYHILSRVNSGGDAVYLLSVAGLIACNDASLCEAFSCSWSSPAPFYKLREIERSVLLLGRLLPRRKWLLFLTLLRAAFRSALGRRTWLLGCLRGHALRRGWLMVLLLLEHGALTLQDLWLLHWRRLLLERTLALLRLWLLLLEDALPLQGLWLWYLWLWLLLLLESTLAFLRLLLLLEGTLALLFLPLLELLLDLLLLLRLTVAVRFGFLSTPCRLPLYT
jgi:hypothetical protein